MNTITGKNAVGYTLSSLGHETFKTFNPSTATYLHEEFYYATKEELEAIMQLAASAFPLYKKRSDKERATFLEAIADEIMNLGDELIDRCMAETGLPQARIVGERGRTCGQLKLFAQTLKAGDYLQVRIDTAIPDRLPLPRPDIRRMLVSIGPVLVFGASNFPLAFSTAGGDTASALAAGCPVIVKAHPSHAGTNDLITQAIIKAARSTNMPNGVFCMFYGDRDLAVKAVEQEEVKAVGFTGSRQGGMALFKAAMNRPEPIPVFAEMSSVNPVIILPGAISEKGEAIAAGFFASVTNGVGQFCTNPGLVFLLKGEQTEEFKEMIVAKFKNAQPGTMLNTAICDSYQNQIKTLEQNESVTQISTSAKAALIQKTEAAPFLFEVDAHDFLKQNALQDEVFGPASLLIMCNDLLELQQVLGGLEGQLTATIHAGSGELKLLETLVDIMTQKAGRVLFGGFPTGVEVSPAQQHGGPFPASTDSRFTSVGSAAIYRFLRPVTFQDFPDELLPEALKQNNPLDVPRMVNGF